jgi:hypothetical protein
VYVVTFNPAPVTCVGMLDGLRRMSLSDARSLRESASLIPMSGRIINVETLETVD